MKTILEIIENVSPDDTDTLDEIDARVWCYISNGNINYVDKDHGEIEGVTGVFDWTIDTTPYTRSRDALKAIRPDGWQWDIGIEQGDYTCIAFIPEPEKAIAVCHGGSEELAELHAIIQAIQHERVIKRPKQ